MTWKDYSSTYADGNVYYLIVKFTFEDNAGKENIFIGSAFRNDDECSVGFGGYITVDAGFNHTGLISSDCLRNGQSDNIFPYNPTTPSTSC